MEYTRSKQHGERTMKLGLMMVIKNEAHCMDEFIQHYIGEGVDHFYIVDNDSTDNLRDVLKPYKDIIDVYSWIPTDIPIKWEDEFGYFHRGQFHCDAYKLILLNSSIRNDMDWIIQVNPDEYMYTRLGYPTIKDLLIEEGHAFSQLSVVLKNFGPENIVKQPKSIVDTFTLRAKMPHVDAKSRLCAVKSITKSEIWTDENINRNIGVHCNRLTGVENPVTANFRLQLFGGVASAHTHRSLRLANEGWYDVAPIHCNHYQVQSLEDWCRRAKNGTQYPKVGHPNYKSDGIKNYNGMWLKDWDNWGRADLAWLTNRYETYLKGKRDTELKDKKSENK